MKNKKLLYLLVPLMMAVWGSVFYRIFNGSGGGDTFVNDYMAPVMIPPMLQRDSFVLITKYKDPFLGRGPKSTQTQNPVSTTPPKVKVVVPPKPVIPWPELSYGGLIRNTNSGKSLALLTVNGQQKLAISGQEVAGITIEEMWSDSLMVTFGKEARTIRKAEL